MTGPQGGGKTGWRQVYCVMPPGLIRVLKKFASTSFPPRDVSEVIVKACAVYVGYDPIRDEQETDGDDDE